MLLNLFYVILGTFYTLLNNTDLDLSYFDLSYVFPGHIDSVKRGLTVQHFLTQILPNICCQILHLCIKLQYSKASFYATTVSWKNIA